MNLRLTQLYGPLESAALKLISKSPLAKNVATVFEASGKFKFWLISIIPALSLNGHVQSMPYSLTPAGHTVGLKLAGKRVSTILHKSGYRHEPTLTPPAT